MCSATVSRIRARLRDSVRPAASVPTIRRGDACVSIIYTNKQNNKQKNQKQLLIFSIVSRDRTFTIVKKEQHEKVTKAQKHETFSKFLRLIRYIQQKEFW